MVARVIYLIVLNAAFLIALIWYLPIANLLDVRGYDPEQIAAVEEVLAQGPGEPRPEDTPDARRTRDSAAPENGDGARTAPGPASEDAELPEPDSAEPGEVPEDASSEPPQELVATDVINVRAGRGTDTEIIGQLSSGTVVEVVANPDGDWIKIDHDTGTGWVYRPLFKSADE